MVKLNIMITLLLMNMTNTTIKLHTIKPRDLTASHDLHPNRERRRRVILLYTQTMDQPSHSSSSRRRDHTITEKHLVSNHTARLPGEGITQLQRNIWSATTQYVFQEKGSHNFISQAQGQCVWQLWPRTSSTLSKEDVM